MFFLLIIVSLISFNCSAKQTTSHEVSVPFNGKTIVFTIKNTVTGKNENHLFQINTSTIQNDQQIPLPPEKNSVSPCTLPFVDQSKTDHSIFKTLLCNKLKCSAGLVASVYAAIIARLYLLSKSISQTELWANWRLDVPLTVLYELPIDDVTSELRTAIQAKYSKNKDSISYLNATVLFMNDIEKEIAFIKHLFSIHAWIDWMHLSLLFPKQKSLIEQANHALNRLEFLKNLVNTYMLR